MQHANSWVVKRKSSENSVLFFPTHIQHRHELAKSRSLTQDMGIHPDGGGMDCPQGPPESA